MGVGEGGRLGGGAGQVTWLGLGGCSCSSVPGQEVHQQLPLPGPGGVGVQVGVGVGEDVGGGGARPRGRPVSVPSPGPGYGTRAVLAFSPPQAFRGQDRTTTPVMSGHRQNSSAQTGFASCDYNFASRICVQKST